MNKKVIGIALAFICLVPAVIAGVPALAADQQKLQSGSKANSTMMYLDRCPYYPSHVVCGMHRNHYKTPQMPTLSRHEATK
jgi:hypothetical protein